MAEDILWKNLVERFDKELKERLSPREREYVVTHQSEFLRLVELCIRDKARS